MVLKRLKKWKLCRKNSWAEMCEGARQLASLSLAHEGALPDLIIRGRVVTSADLLRYFRRKQIPDPIGCAMHLNYSRSEVVDVVSLVDDEDARDIEDEIHGREAGTALNLQPVAPATSSPGDPHTTRRTNSRARLTSSLSVHRPSHIGKLDNYDRILWSTRAYCMSYLESPQHSEHIEPQVHRLTLHGIFQQQMQNGMAILLRDSPKEAFSCFRDAFDQLSSILGDSHIMSLALILTVICELERRKMQTLVNSLLRHLFEMSEVKFVSQHPFIEMFKALSTSHEHRSSIIVRAMQVCLAEMNGRVDRRDWKRLYVQERLCDCLYYANIEDDRIVLRRGLLKQQEEMYGIHARNVLWTMSNIADDALQLQDFDEAEAVYEVILARAEKLEGYGKGKTRYAALEGLARMYRIKGEGLRERFVSRFGHCMAREQYMCLLRKSVERAQAAELEARSWFEPCSRRIATAESERMLSVGLLRSMNEDASGWLFRYDLSCN